MEGLGPLLLLVGTAGGSVQRYDGRADSLKARNPSYALIGDFQSRDRRPNLRPVPLNLKFYGKNSIPGREMQPLMTAFDWVFFHVASRGELATRYMITTASLRRSAERLIGFIQSSVCFQHLSPCGKNELAVLYGSEYNLHRWTSPQPFLVLFSVVFADGFDEHWNAQSQRRLKRREFLCEGTCSAEGLCNDLEYIESGNEIVSDCRKEIGVGLHNLAESGCFSRDPLDNQAIGCNHNSLVRGRRIYRRRASHRSAGENRKQDAIYIRRNDEPAGNGYLATGMTLLFSHRR